MTLARMIYYVALMVLALRSEAATVDIASCDDLETAVAATATEDTTATFTTSYLSCREEADGDDEYALRTYTITNNRLTIEAPDEDEITMYDARFDLVSSGELSVVPDIHFDMTSRIDAAVVSSM